MNLSSSAEKQESQNRFSFYFMSVLFIIPLVVFFVFPAEVVYGATATWDGSSDDNWDTAANWSTGQVPDSSTDVVFDDTDTSVVNMNVSTSIKSLELRNNFTGTLQLSQNLSISNTTTITEGSFDVGNNYVYLKGLLKLDGSNGLVKAGDNYFYAGGGIEINSGKFNQENATVETTEDQHDNSFLNIKVNGGEFIGSDSGSSAIRVKNYIQTGGVVTSTNDQMSIYNTLDINGGTFNHNNGKVKLNNADGTIAVSSTNKQAFNDFAFIGNLIFKDDLKVKNNFEINGVNSVVSGNSHNINIGGNFIKNISESDYLLNNITINLDGSGIQQITSKGLSFDNLKIAQSSVSATTSLQDDLTVSGTLEIATGTIKDGGNNIKIMEGWNNSGSNIGMDLSATTTFAGSGTLKVTSSEQTFNDVHITRDNKGDTLTIQDEFTAAGTMTVAKGVFDADINTTTVKGLTKITGQNGIFKAGNKNFYPEGGVEISNGKFEQENANIKTNGSDSGSDYSNLKVGGGKFIGNSKVIFVKDLIQSGGVVTSTSNSIRIAGNINITGGTFNHNNGALQLIAGTTVSSTNSQSFYNFNLNNGQLTLKDGLNIDNDISIVPTSGTIFGNNNTTTVAGNINHSNSGSFSVTNTHFVMGGSGTQQITSKGLVFDDLKIAHSSVSATTSLQDALTVSGTIEVATGTLDTKSKNTTVSSDLTFNGGGVSATKAMLTVSGNSIANMPNATTADLFNANILTPQGGNESSTASSSFNYNTIFDISGEKVEFSSGTVLTLADTNNSKDFTKINVTSTISSGLPSKATKKGGVQFGFSNSDLNVDKLATVTIAVSSVSQGDTLDVYQKKAGENWKDSGTNCTVNGSNECIFTTKTFSEFAAATTSSGSPSSNGSSSSGGGSSFTLTQDSPEISSGSDVGMKINSGADSTNDKKVSISFNVQNTEKVALSEKEYFSGVSYKMFPDSQEMSYTLSTGNGEKTVYARLQSKGGATLDLSDSIKLGGSSDGSVACTMQYDPVCGMDGKTYSNRCVAENQNNVSVEYERKCSSNSSFSNPTGVELGIPVKTSNSRSVGMTVREDGQLKVKWFRTADKYFSYFDSWNDVWTVKKSTMDQIPESRLGFMPWGPNRGFKNGTLMKTVTDPKVYIVNGNYKNWIKNEEVFEALGYDWSLIVDVSKNLLEQYEKGWEIDYTDHHPSYTLIKYSDSSKVYRLEPNSSDQLEKRHIKNEQAFESLNYRWDSIVEISNDESYPTGLPIEG